MFELVTFAPGAPIIAEGVNDGSLYILQSGVVEICKGELKVAEIAEHGTFFGEISAILDQPRSCTVRAKTECDILVLAQSINEIVAHHPHLTKRLLEAMAERIVKATHELATTQHTLISFQEASPVSLSASNSR